MKFSSRHYAQALYDLHLALPAKSETALIGALLTVLRRRRDRRLMSSIIRSYTTYALAQEGKESVDVLLARAQAAAGLRRELESAMQTKVALRSSEDPRLIGGAVIRRGDMLVDGSVAAQLSTLRRALGGRMAHTPQP